MKSKIASIFCILAGILAVNLFSMPDAAAQSEPAAPACEAEVERLTSGLEELKGQHRALKARVAEALMEKKFSA